MAPTRCLLSLFIFNKPHQSLPDGLSIIWKTETGDEMLHLRAHSLGAQVNTTAAMQK